MNFQTCGYTTRSDAITIAITAVMIASGIGAATAIAEMIGAVGRNGAITTRSVSAAKLSPDVVV
jgi:hypothetical protein